MTNNTQINQQTSALSERDLWNWFWKKNVLRVLFEQEEPRDLKVKKQYRKQFEACKDRMPQIMSASLKPEAVLRITDWLYHRRLRYINEVIPSLLVDSVLKEHWDELVLEAMFGIEQFYTENCREPLELESKQDWELCLEDAASREFFDYYWDEFFGIADSFEDYILQKTLVYLPELRFLRNMPKHMAPLLVKLQKSKVVKRLVREVRRIYSPERMEQFILQNEYYTGYYEELCARLQKEEDIRNNILRTIPERYVDVYPLARTLHRHFTIVAGPTNSGKTYYAVQRLKEAERGIYLGPLRLLAMEVFETLNQQGCPCTLLTGEEKIEVPFSTHQASTVEMLSLQEEYDVVVIDEAQMLRDRERGAKWTRAILGAVAKEIVVCCAKHAVPLLQKLIEDCGDTWELQETERATPLVFETKESFHFPESVREKDALVVFSKRTVLSVASELQRQGIPCSVIYGALPYDVRKEEARKFYEGETKVVVATDAIGMGLNLPISRVVFLESRKFDGFRRRDLKAEEIQQIAGRAGRRGQYSVGYVNSFGYKKLFEKNLEKNVSELQSAYMMFPDSLLGIDAPLSEILQRWTELPDSELYRQCNTNELIRRCKILEPYSDDKDLIFRFVTMPVEEDRRRIGNLWLQMFLAEKAGKILTFSEMFPDYEDIMHMPNKDTQQSLDALEMAYRICDLCFHYCHVFGYNNEVPTIMDAKRAISDAMTAILKEQKLPEKVCKRCGVHLNWNRERPYCKRCVDKLKFDKYVLNAS